jgi:hypothetical protein
MAAYNGALPLAYTCVVVLFFVVQKDAQSVHDQVNYGKYVMGVNTNRV